MKKRVLIRVAFRSLFLEASWNYRGQQGLGAAAALDPALALIHGSGGGLAEARRRTLKFFNTNPITAGLALGAAVNLEERMAAGQLSASDRDGILRSLTQVLAILGDNFFWRNWLPFCALVSVWLTWTGLIWWAPFLLPLFFVLPSWPLQFCGVFWGYRRGAEILDFLEAWRPVRLIQAVGRAAAVLGGLLTIFFLKDTIRLTNWLPGFGGLWAAALIFAFFVFGLRLAVDRIRILNYWHPLVLAVFLTAGAVWWAHMR